jgi:Immunoglobulin-like domain of bacterial spore germination
MRRIRPLLVAGTLVLAVGIGTTVALTTRQAPTATAAAPAGQPAASPAAAAASHPSTAPTPTTPTTPKTPDTPDRTKGAKAVATARGFLARELGMTELIAGPFRTTGARTGEVGFRHKYGEGRRLLSQTGPYAVVVRLQRLPAGWWVLGVDGRSIQITSPARLQRISSPLTVRGTAEVYEGTLYFKVTQDRPGRDLLLGQGFVGGSASQPGDLGQLRFRQPTSTAPGWVIFYDAANDGSNGIIQATMVRVQFTAATPAPRILAVTTSPRLRTLEGGWLELPPGAGTVVFSVKATNAQRVRFVLTPTGTETDRYAQLLGEDRDPRDGFTLTWRYPSQGLSAHLDIQAIGQGGTTDKSFGIAH